MCNNEKINANMANIKAIGETALQDTITNQKDKKVIWITGDNSLMLLQMALDIAKSYSNSPYVCSECSKPWEDYNDESVVILNDFTGLHPVDYRQFMDLTNPFLQGLFVSVRYRNKRVNPDVIIVTSGFTPREYYGMSHEFIKPKYKFLKPKYKFLRERITCCIQVDSKNISKLNLMPLGVDDCIDPSYTCKNPYIYMDDDTDKVSNAIDTYFDALKAMPEP